VSIEAELQPDAPIEKDGSPLLEVDHLKVLFPIKSGVLVDRKIGFVHAVDDVSFELRAGETLGVVGESGCGKTTLIRALVRLVDPTAGAIRFRGADITSAGRRQLEPVRREMQMVFQDPQASLNPRKRVNQILATPLRMRGVPKARMQDESRQLLQRVGLHAEHLNRYPHEFSGGQRQRIGIARALAVEPRLMMLDEPVSALDVSIQAQVINLLDELQDEFHLSYLFVAHDLSVVRHVSDRIAVMYLGKLMEISPAEELYTRPIHPYTSALLDAIPLPDPNENRARERPIITGEPPNPIRPPSGCRFHTRCPRATEICRSMEPQLTEYAGAHLAACHHPQHMTSHEIAESTRSPASPAAAGDQAPVGEDE
jgi:oligopeptide/dipeptide ABC transporter ATP-binding protein